MGRVDPLPFELTSELGGWRLLWARLSVAGAGGDRLAAIRAEAAADARQRFPDTAAISGDPTVAALRTLFRAAGCDPTRHRPSSEALLRRLVKGHELPAILPLVDFNNCLSAALAVPCCVMTDGSFGGRLTWRAGREGEAYESLRGPFNLAGKPLLLDDQGPLDTPITGNVRVKVEATTAVAWLVAYTPAATVEPAAAHALMERLAAGTGIGVRSFAAAD